MFENVTTAYDLRDATWEILIMLGVAFLLGYLLRGCKKCVSCKSDGERVGVDSGKNINLDNNSDTSNSFTTDNSATMSVVSGVTALSVFGKDFSSDDLKIVEGIGPKIEELLKDAGIRNWSDLADTSVDRLKEILEKAGDRFRMHEPTTWPEQSAMARDGKWEALKKYQDFLIGGK